MESGKPQLKYNSLRPNMQTASRINHHCLSGHLGYCCALFMVKRPQNIVFPPLITGANIWTTYSAINDRTFPIDGEVEP